jgi:hypothetical protein
MPVAGPVAVASKRHRLAPPPWRIFDALTTEVSDWFSLRPGEVEPRIVSTASPSLVVWSSLWPARPLDVIEFHLEPDGAGCGLQLVWLTEAPPDGEAINLVRHRLNYAIGGELRGFVDQRG